MKVDGKAVEAKAKMEMDADNGILAMNTTITSRNVRARAKEKRIRKDRDRALALKDVDVSNYVVRDHKDDNRLNKYDDLNHESDTQGSVLTEGYVPNTYSSKYSQIRSYGIGRSPFGRERQVYNYESSGLESDADPLNPPNAFRKKVTNNDQVHSNDNDDLEVLAATMALHNSFQNHADAWKSGAMSENMYEMSELSGVDDDSQTDFTSKAISFDPIATDVDSVGESDRDGISYRNAVGFDPITTDAESEYVKHRGGYSSHYSETESVRAMNKLFYESSNKKVKNLFGRRDQNQIELF